MKKRIQHITKKLSIAALLIAFIAVGCSDVAGPNENSSVKSSNYDGSSEFHWGSDDFTSTSNGELTNGETKLVYGKKRVEIGVVSFVVNGTDLVLTYDITNNKYPISETNVWVADSGENLSDVPNSASGPKLGHFPYINQHNDVLHFEQTIDLTTHGFTAETVEGRLYVVAHAVVGKNETAFAGCYEMLDAGSRWWNALNFWNYGDSTKERCHDKTSGKNTNGQP